MPAQLLNAPLYQLVLAVLSASLLVSALMTLPLKFAAESVFKFPVRVLDAFKAMFVSTLTLTSMLFGLIWLRVLDLNAGGGIALQILGQPEPESAEAAWGDEPIVFHAVSILTEMLSGALQRTS